MQYIMTSYTCLLFPVNWVWCIVLIMHVEWDNMRFSSLYRREYNYMWYFVSVYHHSIQDYRSTGRAIDLALGYDSFQNISLAKLVPVHFNHTVYNRGLKYHPITNYSVFNIFSRCLIIIVWNILTSCRHLYICLIKKRQRDSGKMTAMLLV